MNKIFSDYHLLAYLPEVFFSCFLFLGGISPIQSPRDTFIWILRNKIPAVNQRVILVFFLFLGL